MTAQTVEPLQPGELLELLDPFAGARLDASVGTMGDGRRLTWTLPETASPISANRFEIAWLTLSTGRGFGATRRLPSDDGRVPFTAIAKEHLRRLVTEAVDTVGFDRIWLHAHRAATGTDLEAVRRWRHVAAWWAERASITRLYRDGGCSVVWLTPGDAVRQVRYHDPHRGLLRARPIGELQLAGTVHGFILPDGEVVPTDDALADL